MPRDEDEDTSSAYPPPGVPVRAGPARQPPTAVKPVALLWGVCGVTHLTGELTAYPGSTGVIRFVGSGVSHATPPTGGGRWRDVPSEPGRYEMLWDGDPATARTLGHLRADLERAARGQQMDRNHPLLRELDAVAGGLVSVAEGLHRRGWSLGLVRPDGVVLSAAGDPILVDLGFTWQGVGQPPWDDSPGRPSWVADEETPTWLWDEPPVRRQFAAPTGGAFPPADAASDVRVLGRLLFYLLTGRQDRVVPPTASAPDYWQTLAAAAAGRVPTADVLAERLRQYPLSEHFAKPVELPPPPPPPSSGAGKWVAAAVVLLAVAATAFFVVDPLGTKVKPTDPTRPDVADGGTTPTGLTKPPGSPPTASKEGDPPQKADTAAFDAIWAKEYPAALDLADKPAQRAEAAQRFADLYTRLKPLADGLPVTDPAYKKEQECLTTAKFYAEALGWSFLPR